MLSLPVPRRFARTQTVRVLSAGPIVYDECHSIFNVLEERRHSPASGLASDIPSSGKRMAIGFSTGGVPPASFAWGGDWLKG